MAPSGPLGTPCDGSTTGFDAKLAPPSCTAINSLPNRPLRFRRVQLTVRLQLSGTTACRQAVLLLRSRVRPREAPDGIIP